MSREVRLFLHSIGEETRWEAFQAFLLLTVSQQARKRNRRYCEVQAAFKAALADSDTVYDLELNRVRKPTSYQWHRWAMLGVLIVIGLLEWGMYSGPRLTEWCGTILHKCGLR
jgi:hypothetical protein